MSQRRPLHLCFGGTFDPVHNAHLRVLWETSLTLVPASVRLFPCHVPPHKAAPDTSPAHRLAMLRLALADQPNWQLDTRELDREGPSYSVDTLAHLREEMGPDAALVWLVGMDSFAALDSWHRWRELADYAHLLVVGRPGSAPPDSGPVAEWAAGRTVAAEELVLSASGRVAHLATTDQDIASSDLRRAAARGVSPRYLVPEAVCNYIDEQGLYQSLE